MNEIGKKVTSQIFLLKESRLQLLRLHKLLLDIERQDYEEINGPISSGLFLNILVGEKSFQWLRKFSTLIADIDEMLDIDDGYTKNMVDKHLTQMRDLLNLKASDAEFNEKYKIRLQSNSEVAGKHSELKKLLAE